MIDPYWFQRNFRFRNDNGSETTATWKAAEDTNVTQPVNQVFRLRAQVAQTDDATGSLAVILRYSLNGGAYTNVAAIGSTTSPVRFATSANVSDGTATTSQLTLSPYTSIGGEIDNNNTTASLSYSQAQLAEYEFILELYGPQLAANNTLDFRIYKSGGTVLEFYQSTPRATAVFTLAPNAPILSTPANEAEIAGASEQTFTWQFSSDEPGDSQTAFAFAREGLGAWSKYTSVPSTLGIAHAVAFNPSGSLLACGINTAQNSSYLVVFNTTDWSEVSPGPVLPYIGGGQRCYGVAFSPNGSFLAVTHTYVPGVHVYSTLDWSEPNPSLVASTQPYARGVAFSPDSSLLAVVWQQDSPNMRVYRTSDFTAVSGSPVLTANGNGPAFSPDGSLLAVTISASPFLKVFNTSDWSEVSGVSTTAAGINCVFSPDGTLLAIALGVSPFLRVLNTSNWTVVSGTPVLPGVVPNGARGVAFSPDGSILAVAHNTSPFVILLNTTDWSEISTVSVPAGKGEAVAFSGTADPPNLLLAVGHQFTPCIAVFTNEPTLHTQYWNGTSWQASEVFVNSTTQGVTFPADSWSDT